MRCRYSWCVGMYRLSIRKLVMDMLVVVKAWRYGDIVARVEIYYEVCMNIWICGSLLEGLLLWVLCRAKLFVSRVITIGVNE